MNDAAVRTIIEYLENSDAPEVDWPQQWYEEVCFSRWAAEELINAILDHPMAPAEDTIEEFIIKMEVYASMSEGRDCGRIFSIAAETATEILELI